MIIKRFEAQTETEAIVKAKDELGKDAMVVSIKTIKPRGIYRIFKKSMVEVTAAVDDKEKVEVRPKASVRTPLNTGFTLDLDRKNTEKERMEPVTHHLEETEIEKKLNSLKELLEQQVQGNQSTSKEEDSSHKEEGYFKVVYDKLIENEVDELFAKKIMEEIEGALKKDATLDTILTNVYQKIVLKLGEPRFIDLQNKQKRFIFFIGPTGVGKTTTIAKIASQLKLKEKAKVALITSDTYRIAAVEQLRTYANILGVPLSVVYTKEELEEEKEKYADFDVVLIDTAGRSHRNEEQKKDLREMVNVVDEEEREVFLVLSATTKYNDLVKITESYSDINDYSIIFTKLDETICIGNILNIKLLTNAPLSYTTWGQNVPDDFGNIDAQSIAKKLLGGNN